MMVLRLHQLSGNIDIAPPYPPSGECNLATDAATFLQVGVETTITSQYQTGVRVYIQDSSECLN